MKTCPSCGAETDDGARFCLECGYAFEASVAETADPWQGRMVAGRFRIVRKLGDGGMGEVFLAEQVPMGRSVALKVLRQSLSDDPEQVARFKREAQAASQLQHPNTIIVHDFGQDEDGTLFIAMEFLEGQPLDTVLDAQGTLEPARAARIMAQVCASLNEAHARHMVHRDLKPENIFLVERGTPDFVKVLDFGIAKVTQSSTGEKLESITRAGAVFGTPHYMAPEQIRGEELDARADVYALGVILYRMIAGHLPFEASTVMEMLTKHLTAEPAPIQREGGRGDPAARARLEAVALRALSKQPEQRQSSALAFVEDIMAAVPGMTLSSITGLVPLAAASAVDVPVGPALSPPPVTEERSGGRGGLIALLVLLLAGGGFAAWWFTGPGAPGGGGLQAILGQQAEGGDEGGGGETGGEEGGEKAAEGGEKAAEGGEKAAEGGEKAAEGGEKAAEGGEKAAEGAGGEAAAAGGEGGEAAAAGGEGGEAAAAGGDATATETEEAAGGEDGENAAQDGAAGAEMNPDEAAQVAAAAAAEEARAAEEQKRAEAEKARIEAEERAKAAEAEKSAAEAARAAAEAQKAEAEAARQKAEAEKRAAEEAAAQAAAKAAANDKRAQAAVAMAKAERLKAEAAAKRAQAEAARLKAEMARLEAEKVVAAKAAAEAEAARVAAEAKVVEAETRKAEAAEKKVAAKKGRKAASFGQLSVATRVAGAKVMVNGRAVGLTPMKKAVRLKPGRHRVEVIKGDKRMSKTVTVNSGKVKRLSFSL